MYASTGFLRSDIGDVDVLYHDGQFHLFHLVLPNHDFIAHAVSEDGLSWRRVKNALFVGEPGTWDDDMLWTMHVSPDPEKPGAWRMFYTGLARAEFGRVQRVGLARSDDLIHWTRDDSGSFPLAIDHADYESDPEAGRKWVSFRDPYFYHDPKTHRRMLLASARIDRGPLIRRGCVAVAHEVEPGRFEFGPPLHHPGLYDDVEVPNLIEVGGRHFLLGSIREDTKVHYWYTDDLETQPFENFFDNVMLPRGNYAARVCRRGDELLLFNFFAKTENLYGRTISKKLLPPPKNLVTDATGRLRVKSFRGFDDLVEQELPRPKADELDHLFVNRHAKAGDRGNGFDLNCVSGYEAYLLPGEHESLRVRMQLALEGSGKFGMVLRVDAEGNGYYLSLDLIKGVAQLRSWGVKPYAETEYAFDYHQLQAGYFVSDQRGPWDIEVVAHGMYLEVSIGGYVTLSLVDDAFGQGRFGFYCESATLKIRDLTWQQLAPPQQEVAHGPIYSTKPDEPMPDAMPDLESAVAPATGGV
jgi:beta-fructofuranosidase